MFAVWTTNMTPHTIAAMQMTERPTNMSNNNVELGMVLFSNGAICEHDADWATSGVNLLAEVIAEIRNNGKKPPKYGWPLLTSNSGEESFENDTFSMRSYCWCYGGGDHENGCPPNFKYKPDGLEISWYKHAGRGITCNQQEPSMLYWFDVLAACVASIEK